MTEYVATDFSMMGNSTNCHTLDRHNSRAFFECGPGDGEFLKNYTDLTIIANHWPQVQDSEMRECLITFYPNNYYDASYASSALMLSINIAGLIGLFCYL